MEVRTTEAPTARSTAVFSELVHEIYATATQSSRWSQVVAAIGQSLGADHGMLFTPFLGPQGGGFLFTWKLSEDDLNIWATRYIAHDIWAARALEQGQWREGSVYLDREIVPTDEFRRSLIYREYFQRIGVEWMCCGGVFEGAAGLPHTAISYFRGPDRLAFEQADKEWLRLLLPHLSRSLGLMHRLNVGELNASSLRATLDRVAFGVALLDPRGKVLHLNATAQAVVARGDGLTVNDAGMLDAAGAKGRERLRHWIERMAASADAHPEHFNDGFVALRSAAAQRYLVQYSVLPVRSEWANANDTIRYVAFITDPDATQLPPAERLSALYGLTQAEVRVALELAHGSSQKQVAMAVGVAPTTVRTQAQSVYAKMRIQRHADLMRIVLSLGQVKA